MDSYSPKHTVNTQEQMEKIQSFHDLQIITSLIIDFMANK